MGTTRFVNIMIVLDFFVFFAPAVCFLQRNKSLDRKYLDAYKNISCLDFVREFSMRRLAAVIIATILSTSAVLADTSAPLAPGKPAGVHDATLAGSGLLFFFGLAVVGGGIALVSTQGSSGNHITATTTSTAP